MNWKKTVLMTTLTAATLFALAGCGETTAPATTASEPTATATPAAEQTTTAAAAATVTATPEPATQLAPDGTPPVLPQDGEMREPGTMPEMPEMDLAAAAAELGVTEEQLTAALGDMTQAPLDLASVAATLGVTEAALAEALGMPAGFEPDGRQAPGELTQTPALTEENTE